MAMLTHKHIVTIAILINSHFSHDIWEIDRKMQSHQLHSSSASLKGKEKEKPTIARIKREGENSLPVLWRFWPQFQPRLQGRKIVRMRSILSCNNPKLTDIT